MLERAFCYLGLLLSPILGEALDREKERENFRRLVDYYEENGATLHAFMDWNQDGIRGLFASKAFEKYEIILSIPLFLVFRCESRTDYLCIFDFAPVLTEHIETRGKTNYSSYIETLPRLKHFEQTRIYYLREEILKDFEPWLPTVAGVLRLKKYFLGKLPQNGEYAWHLIVSRALHYAEPDGGERSYLIGVMDLINHDFLLRNVGTTFNGTHLMLLSIKPIAQYEELFFVYMKDKNNTDFVRALGFYEEQTIVKLSSLSKGACLKVSRLFKKYTSKDYEEERYKLSLLFELYKERCGVLEAKFDL
jgi:hypothetical protein